MGADEAGAKSVVFNTITVSDGISMGTPGMRYSLVSREVIADSIETVVGAQGFDGFVTIGGCDKNMPACAMAMARLDRPSVFVYGGTILPGAQRRDIISVFEAVGAHAAGKIGDVELLDVEKTAIPGPGSCGGMYTANTMASAIEALGLSLPNSSAQTAVSDNKRQDSYRAGATVAHLIERGIKPSDILSRESFENAITVAIALEGSTNAVLHLLAIANAAGIPLELDDFTRIGDRVPVLADMRPAGRYAMSELIEIGGIRPLMKTLLDAALLHGGCLTVTGRTLAEDLGDVAPYPEGQRIIRPLSDPIKKDSHLVVLYGNLAPTGAVAKITGHEGLAFTGRAKVYHGEEAAMAAIMDGSVQRGDVVVVRYEGPARRSGHAGDAEPDQRHQRPRAVGARRPHHGRAFLRRLPRVRDRPHHAGGFRGRTDRAPRGRRRDHDRRGAAAHRRGARRGRTGPAARRLDAARALCTQGGTREVRAAGEFGERGSGHRRSGVMPTPGRTALCPPPNSRVAVAPHASSNTRLAAYFGGCESALGASASVTALRSRDARTRRSWSAGS